MTPFQEKQLALMRQMEHTLQRNPSASQTVSIQTDYATDPQLTLTSVSFMATNIADQITTTLIEPLRLIDPTQYFFPKESLHITIQNVRVVNDPPHFDAAAIERAKSVFADVIKQHNKPLFTLHGLLSMPTSIAVIALVTPEYDQLVRHLRSELKAHDIADDKFYFTDEIVFANTTICRYTTKPNKQWFNFIHANADVFIGNFSPSDVSLISTNAGCHPSKTTVLGTYTFR